MTECVISLAGMDARLLPEGALWLAASRTLTVADLHFEKGSAFAKRGVMLPPYDTRATLLRLQSLCKRYRPDRVIALGDSFHDVEGPDRLASADHRLLREMTGGCAWIWITGNHDADAAAACGGSAVETFAVGALTFRHEPAAGSAFGEVCGHLHPKAALVIKGRRIGKACFVSDGSRMVMPAFGAFTGGLDVFDPAFFPIFPAGFRAHLLGRDRVHTFPHQRLLARRVA